MDVVRAEVNALGGRIETTTEAGKGTNFKLVLPLTTAVTQVVMIRSGHAFDRRAGQSGGNRPPYAYQGSSAGLQLGLYEFGQEQLPFYWSGALLQASQSEARNRSPKPFPVVVFRSAASGSRCHVDEVLGNQEVVVKNLGRSWPACRAWPA